MALRLSSSLRSKSSHAGYCLRSPFLLCSGLINTVRAIDAAITYDVEADHPWAFSPLLATVNTLSVKFPMDSSDTTSSIDSLSVKEDTDLLAEIGADPGMKAGQRRSFFAKDSNRKLMISPDKVRIPTAPDPSGFNLQS